MGLYDQELSKATSMQPFMFRQVLLYAIAQIQALPAERQETSTLHHLCKMARTMLSEGDMQRFAYAVWGVECHVGAQINLWPAHGGDGPSGHYTDEEFEAEETLRKTITDFADRFARSGALVDAPPSDVVKFID